MPHAAKHAIVPKDAARAFDIVDAASGKAVLPALPGAPALWKPLMERVRLADFSSLNTPGRYRIRVKGLTVSDPFVIQAGACRALNNAALKSYFFTRSG